MMTTVTHPLPHSSLGLSMSGGGLSALAYLGFVEELKKAGIEPELYAGLSGGAIIAVLLASGLSTLEVVDFFKHIRFWQLLNFSWHTIEVFDHHKMNELIHSLLPIKRFEDLPTKALVYASDLTLKQPALFEEGDIASAVLASCSMFPFMQPVKRRGRILGDGGYTVYYGAQYLRERHIKTVVGVDVSGLTERSISGIFGGLYKQINAALTSNARYELHEHHVDLDVQIAFPMPNIFHFQGEIDHLLATGRKAAQKHLTKIKKLV
jgi:NTE family protein